MPRILKATCENKIIKIKGVVVNGTVLSSGIGASEGVALLDKSELTYLTTNTTDLKESLVKINDAILKIGEILTSIGAGMTGPTTVPPPTLPTGVVELTNIGIELIQLSEQLK